MLIWYFISCEHFDSTITIVFLNVGQGDAIYIESPVHNRIIIDGGPPQRVLSELDKVMPFYVHSIDTVISTNPDKQYIAGLIDIINSYHIKHIIESKNHSQTQTHSEFQKLVRSKHIDEIIAKRGMVIHLGGGASIYILFPNQNVEEWKPSNGSIVAKLIYGKTSVLFMSDAPEKTEKYIVSLSGTYLKSNVLKVSHYGGRGTITDDLLKTISPSYAVISIDEHNKQGYPYQMTLDLLKKYHIKTLKTFEKGTIMMKSDGNVISLFQ